MYALNLHRTRLQYLRNSRVETIDVVKLSISKIDDTQINIQYRGDEYICRFRFEQLTYKRNDAMKALRSHTHVSDMYRKRIAFSVHMHLKALK